MVMMLPYKEVMSVFILNKWMYVWVVCGVDDVYLLLITFPISPLSYVYTQEQVDDTLRQQKPVDPMRQRAKSVTKIHRKEKHKESGQEASFSPAPYLL